MSKGTFFTNIGLVETLTEAVALRYGEMNDFEKWYRNFGFYYLPEEVKNADGTFSYPKMYELEVEESCTIDGQIYQKVCCPDGQSRWF